MLYLTNMRELSYHGESVQRAKVLTQEQTVEWEEQKWGNRENTGKGRQARRRISLFYAWNKKPLLAWHSGMDKYIDSYVCGQKNDCDRVCGENTLSCRIPRTHADLSGHTTESWGPLLPDIPLVSSEDTGHRAMPGKALPKNCPTFSWTHGLLLLPSLSS